MIGASKILTVSYGTFSCTLEGFDDPFNTMRAIAEYFRDLAAEDRYFGAEPPTPDAAMLHRIAEREINRRVEANIQENGVILRAGDIEVTRMPQSLAAQAVASSDFASTDPVLSVTGPSEGESVATRLSRLRDAQAASERDAGAISATEPEEDAEQAAVPEVPQTDVWDTGPAETTMASVLADPHTPEPDSAPVAGLDAIDEPLPTPGTSPDDVTQAEEPASSPAGSDAVHAEIETGEDNSVTDPVAGPVEASGEDVIQTDLSEDGTAERLEKAATEPTDTASDEAVLQAMLGAMIDPDGDDEFDALPLGEPADAEPPVNETVVVETALVEDSGHETAASLTDDSETGALPAPVSGAAVSDDPVSGALLSEAAVSDDPVSETPVIEAPVTGELPTVEPDSETTVSSDADVEVRTDPAEMAIADLIEPAADADPEAPATVVSDNRSAATTLEAEDVPVLQSETRSAERLQRARARVIKIRRIDAGAAATAPGPTADAPSRVAEQSAIAAPVQVPVSALSPEAEAELQRELADLEPHLSPRVNPATGPETPAPDETAASLTEPKKLADPSPADDAVNRLISQTNAAMEGPENKRRLAAIAHLKAAVAATFADRKTNAAPAQPGPAERMDPYRDDLDRVVRPRRPALVPSDRQESGPASARPQMETRAAPLVLVSEQRIDRPASPAAKPFVAPVRPRRVTTDLATADPRMVDSDTDAEADDGYLTPADVNNIFADPTQPFAEFAERLGAVTMPDLMEAAAAYCALQLGRDQFTRPLLLQQIAVLPGGDEFNREDCLRGFGTLLRDGRIQKIKRGQFKLSGKSRYLAEARRVVG